MEIREMSQEEYLIALGLKIKRLRKDLGLSQDQLGEMIGSNRLTIFRIEAGKVNSTIGMLRDLAEALKIELGELVNI